MRPAILVAPPSIAVPARQGGLQSYLSGDIKFHLIYITPPPVFAWLDGFHDRVLGSVEMFRGVLVL